MKSMTLKELKIGKSATITSVGGEGALRRHFLDMGLIPGTVVTLVKMAPMGDPMELKVRDYELTLRLADADHIIIKETENPEQENKISERKKPQPHAGLGEMGVYHPKQRGIELSANDMVTFALAGNQNCGKTTLFNQLTGSNQHVGNFPGVTVDRKDGPIRGQSNTSVTDLPGIYSMSPYTSEEIVTREFILNDRPRGIINIVDATNLERNLYLTMQLMEMDIPMVLALNMMDEVRENGGTILVNELENILGIPVVPISAAKNEGIDELVGHVMHVAKFRERPGRVDFCDDTDSSEGAVHRCIHSIMHLIEDHANKNHMPVRFAASKLIEGDSIILNQLQLDENEKEAIEHIIYQMEQEGGMDREAAIANMRFAFIEKVCHQTVVRPRESKGHIRSAKIDKVLTGKYTALPMFGGIMALIFWLTFGLIGSFLSNLLSVGIDWVTGLCDTGLTTLQINPVVNSLVIDGVFAGVGSVLSFLPTIVTLFFFLSILEDSGYMARVAFVMDKLLRKIGLSGRSFVPMLIGFGCSVPGIMATRTLPSERDRKMTILLTPFMSCSAKLTIYALFTAAFFPKHGALVMIGLYFIGIAVAIIYALILKNTKFKGAPVPFVMELPNYRFPSLKSVLQLIWDKAKDFLSRAFGIIFIASIVIWFLQTFDLRLNVVADSANSLLALLGGFIAPVFEPLGFGDWRTSTALITGFMAKESVVSTLTVLLGGSTTALTTMFEPFTAFVFLVFTLLYTPCVAAVTSVKRELGGKWAFAVVFMQCAIAWIVTYLFNLIGMLF
jgi:ferrous iron transport protein B